MGDRLIDIVSRNTIIIASFRGIALILGTVLLLNIGQAMIRKYFDIVAEKRHNMNKIITLKKVSCNIFKVVVSFIAITMFLGSVLGIDTSSIITVAGVSGVAVGFASQNIVKDLIMGIMLLMEDNITIGDTIKTNGYKGIVEDLNLRSISLRDDAGVLHIIPNNIIKDFSNFSRNEQGKQLEDN